MDTFYVYGFWIILGIAILSVFIIIRLILRNSTDQKISKDKTTVVKDSQVAMIGKNNTIEGDVVFQTASQGTDATKLRTAYLNRILVSTGILSLSGIDPKHLGVKTKNLIWALSTQPF
jgi:hypothetical protein